MKLSVFIANPGYKIPQKGKYEKYFIKSGSRWPHSGVKRKGLLPHYLPFPIQLGYAAAWLRQEGFPVHVMDGVALDGDEAVLLDAVAQTQPGVFFFEPTTPTFDWDVALIKKIKALSPGTHIVLGGAHSSVNARAVLEQCADVEFIIRGEFEEVLLNLLQALEKGEEPKNVLGITYRCNGQIVENPNAPLIEPIEKMPDPAYDLFPSSWAPNPTIYWDGFCQMRPALQMNASRGCPYTCDFCLWIQVMYRNGKYRIFSATRIVDMMARMQQKYGVREFYFDDDDFSIRKTHVNEICEEIIRRGLKLNWSCMADAINLSQEQLKLMAQSGCIGIKFGVETGSERLAKTLGKPINLKHVKEIVKWCSVYRIKTHATFTLGLFGEDRETIQETLDYMANLDVDTIQVSLCTPFPGTAFYKKAEAAGTLKSTEWSHYDGKASEVVAHGNVPIPEMEKMRRRAIVRWFFNRLTSPFWLWKQAHYAARLMRGMGPSFMTEQVYGIVVDEYLLPSAKTAKVS